MNPEVDTFGALYGGKVASDLQTGVTVANGEIYGSLNYIDGGLAESGPLAGSGYFLALKWSDIDNSATSLKVGLAPSIETGLVEAIEDTDHNGVFKITDKDKQRITFVQSDGTNETYQSYGLSNLKLLEPA